MPTHILKPGVGRRFLMPSTKLSICSNSRKSRTEDQKPDELFGRTEMSMRREEEKRNNLSRSQK